MLNNTKKPAIVLTDNLLDTTYGKTAHGLLRVCASYRIVAVIDRKQAGKDAGEMMDGIYRNIPIYEGLPEALKKCVQKPTCVIVGVAPVGGKMSDALRDDIEVALKARLNIISGLHTLLNEDRHFAMLAKQYKVTITDIRQPKRAKVLIDKLDG